jgi:hypothetical protein
LRSKEYRNKSGVTTETGVETHWNKKSGLEVVVEAGLGSAIEADGLREREF